MKKTTRFMAGAVVFVSILVVSLFFWQAKQNRSQELKPVSAHAQKAHNQWPADQILTYHFDWQHQQTMKAQGMDLAADIDLVGDVALRALQTDQPDSAPHSYRVQAEIQSVSRGRYIVAEADLLQNHPQSLVGTKLVLSYSAGGRILDVSASEEQTNTLSQIVRALMLTAQVQTDVQGATREENLLGASSVNYRRQRGKIQRLRSTYNEIPGLDPLDNAKVHIQGMTTATPATIGFVQKIQMSEKTSVEQGGQRILNAQSRLQFSLRNQKATHAPIHLASLKRLDVLGRDPRRDPELQRKLVRNRAQGLSAEKMLQDFAGFASQEQPQANSKWMWQAGGRLALQPELSEQIAQLVSLQTTTSRGRGLGLDLLSQVGHQQAQQALLTSLQNKNVQADPAFPLLLQRMAIVDAPEPDLLAFAEQLRHVSNPQGDAATVALGAMIGHLARHPDLQGLAPSARVQANAEQRIEIFARELESEAEPARQAPLIMALGNSQMHSQQSLLLRLTDSNKARVRQLAVRALDDFNDALVRNRLLKMLTDREVFVQRAAMLALMKQPLAADEQSDLLAKIQADQIHKVNDPLLVNLIVKRLAAGAKSAALRSVLARNDDDSNLRARIHSLLAESP